MNPGPQCPMPLNPTSPRFYTPGPNPIARRLHAFCSNGNRHHHSGSSDEGTAMASSLRQKVPAPWLGGFAAHKAQPTFLCVRTAFQWLAASMLQPVLVLQCFSHHASTKLEDMAWKSQWSKPLGTRRSHSMRGSGPPRLPKPSTLYATPDTP